MRTKTETRFYTRTVKGHTYFAITNDFLEEFKPTKEELTKCRDRGLTDFFELYDDDDNKYYSGYANFDLMEENDMDEFTILDLATSMAGCTYIKTRNKAGKMEMV